MAEAAALLRSGTRRLAPFDVYTALAIDVDGDHVSREESRFQYARALLPSPTSAAQARPPPSYYLRKKKKIASLKMAWGENASAILLSIKTDRSDRLIYVTLSGSTPLHLHA